MSQTLAAGNPALDAERRAALRRMRTVAVALLLFAAAVYLVTLGDEGFLGFVNAGAEASMVGAIADWFAVVALFKHPLGVPVPHTALIPKRKEMLGRSLEEFVGENFLHEDVVRQRVLTAQPTLKAAAWLTDERHARRVVDEAANLLTEGLTRVRDEDVGMVVAEAIVPRLLEEPVSPLAGRLLQEVVADGAHHALVDLVLDEAVTWLRENKRTFHDIVVERAPWWAPEVLNERVVRRLHVELLDWLEEIRADPAHRSRVALDRLLATLADDLLHDPETMERAERFKVRVLSHPQVVATATSFWNALRRALIAALADPEGPLRSRSLAEVTAFATRLQGNPALRERLDAYLADLSVFLVDRYGRDLTAVITHTIDAWDGREASARIELHVGKDLQFVRINGTIVGGLVGVLIHTVSVLVQG
jgi:uncharacterized membrane-anchored protein YjiN (DUF445 family)